MRRSHADNSCPHLLESCVSNICLHPSHIAPSCHSPLHLSWLQGTIKELESKLQKKTPSAEKAPASVEAADKGERQLSTFWGRHCSHPEQKRTWVHGPSLGQLLLQPAGRHRGLMAVLCA